ncbi:MAG: hypothetical protein NTX33_13605 [Propionibacteriales bacterium]|nr:hypothetical protein [Propionibacteriales bacterium]
MDCLPNTGGPSLALAGLAIVLVIAGIALIASTRGRGDRLATGTGVVLVVAVAAACSGLVEPPPASATTECPPTTATSTSTPGQVASGSAPTDSASTPTTGPAPVTDAAVLTTSTLLQGGGLTFAVEVGTGPAAEAATPTGTSVQIELTFTHPRGGPSVDNTVVLEGTTQGIDCPPHSTGDALTVPAHGTLTISCVLTAPIPIGGPTQLVTFATAPGWQGAPAIRAVVTVPSGHTDADPSNDTHASDIP